jgi:hypothetical protein
MDPRRERLWLLTRRALLGRTALGLGSAALASLLGRTAGAARSAGADTSVGPHFTPRAKRIVYLSMNGAPSQMDLFDPKPKMRPLFDTELPASVRQGQRITTMTSNQKRLPIAPSIYAFARHGQSGMEMSELLPHTAKLADKITLVRSMHTESINHDPGTTFLYTGSEQPGRPSFGSWVAYGLGSANDDLPTFVVLHSKWSSKRDAQAIFSRLWSAGFLPSKYQGVSLRSQGDPVLFLSNPDGVDRELRRGELDALAELNGKLADEVGDPEIRARIEQYELAFRMQASVPELTDISKEPASVLASYGPDVQKPGTFAANCLLARRLLERGVRFVQLWHRGWDHHDNLQRDLPLQCADVDQGCRALVEDLDARGLLEDTLVVWGGEFGRTIYCQGELSPTVYGRDHHPRCFSMWLAGGGVKRGRVHGETDDFSYNIVRDPVHVHDLNATLLHCLGLDHERLTWRYQGRDFRLTDVHGKVVRELLT